MKTRIILLATLLGMSVIVAAQPRLGARPPMVEAKPSTASIASAGLSSTSAFLLADLTVGGRDVASLAEKYGFVDRDGHYMVLAFVETEQPEALRAMGVEVHATAGKQLSVGIPAERYVEIAQSGLCSWLDVGARVRPQLNKARAAMGVDAAYNGTNLAHGYDGSGVVVGIIDVGFEYGHPAFYDSTGNQYRVKRVWEQMATSGSAPAGFGYGRELTTTTAILAAQRSEAYETHGTHVASIAAGCGGNTSTTRQWRGMAPMADIVLVATALSSAAVYDGINYIRDYAASQGKPCVINMSLGGHIGPHDGTSSFDRMCDSYLADRPDSLILVGSAGNEGDQKLHVSKLFPGADSTLYTILEWEGAEGGSTTLSLWGDSAVNFLAGLAVMNTQTGTFEDAGYFYNSAASSTEQDVLAGGSLLFTVYAGGEDAYNHRQSLSFDISFNNQDASRRVLLVVQCDTTATVHVWNNDGSFGDGGFSVISDGDNDYSVGELGGSGKSMLSVGAYTTRTQWNALSGGSYSLQNGVEGGLASFSSHGPTLDGRTKPEITAPGQFIVAAINRFNTDIVGSNYTVASTQFGGNTEYYAVFQGTSMSAPMVTGVLALWLQANPSLGKDSALALMRSGAFVDGHTGTIPAAGSNLWGWGKMNALAGLPVEQVAVYSVSVGTENSTMGSVAGGGTYAEGSTVTITATANVGYHFVEWNDGVTTNPRTLTVTGNMSFVARFAEDEFEDCSVVSQLPWSNTFDDELSCWNNIDADGDGYKWRRYGDWAVSESYAYFDQSDKALDPDNWLVSRRVTLPSGAVLTWTAKGLADQYYQEHYSVYVTTGGNSVADFGNASFSETLSSAESITHTASLAAYAGRTIRIAFRHHATHDVFVLGIANVKISVGNVGVDDVELDAVEVYAEGRRIKVVAPPMAALRIVDAAGRTVVAESQVDPAGYVMPAAGVYMVGTADGRYRKVVVR